MVEIRAEIKAHLLEIGKSFHCGDARSGRRLKIGELIP
jgi:hypothetical protein